ncbi:MAG: hypothetical protein U5K69_27785 [Balneolaceae bacterium]|nr:hypothetical protein [Balneolaceae bacterium]
MKRQSAFNSFTLSLLATAIALLFFASTPLSAQEPDKFDYIQKRSSVYYAVLELSGREYIVIGTRSLIRKDMKILQRNGRVGRIELRVMLTNGREKYVSGQVMDNGRNTTFHSRSSARQFVRRLRE